MTTFIKLSLVSLMAISLSCDAAKSSANEEKSKSENATKQMETNLINEGYSKGTISFIKESKCSYIIIDEASGTKFDPINIDEEKYSAFKSEGTKVFYKYRSLRMLNRCSEALPIQLLEIKTQ